MPQTAILALEDGSVYQGRAYGARTVRTGEVVFNTSITGYQEVFTDPSYSGQIVILTNPQIGNYGTNAADDEAAHAWIEGLVVREWSEQASNWRSEETADDYLARQGVPVISELDTRAIVRKLRSGGVMRGALSTAGDAAEELVEMARQSPSMAGLDLATRVSTAQPYKWSEAASGCSPSERVSNAEPGRFHVVAFDYGIKRNILRRLASAGCRLTVVPAGTAAEEVLELKPDGVFLSNGPGDPGAADLPGRAGAEADRADAGVRHLPGAPDHRPGAGGTDIQAEIRAPGDQPSGAEHAHGQGGDYGAEPRLLRGSGLTEGERGRADAHQSQRPDGGGAAAPQRAHLLRPIPPRGGAGAARSRYLFDEFTAMMKEFRGA